MKRNVSFEQLLEQCLQELALIGDVEAVLQRHPQHASELRPLLQVAQAARRHYQDVPAAPGGLAAGRERFLAAAAQQRARGLPRTAPAESQRRTLVRRLKLAFSLRFAAILLAVLLGTTLVGGGVIWAAADSLPGEALYPVKLAVEDLRLAFTAAPAAQVELALQLFEERTTEVGRLAVAGRAVPDRTVGRMEQHIERALTQTAWAGDDEMAGLLVQTAERTQAQIRILEQTRVTAPRQVQAGLQRALNVCRRGLEAARQGLDNPQVFRRRYRHQHGMPEPTDEPPHMTVTPGNGQQQGQEDPQPPRQQRTRRPAENPLATPFGPRATSGPHATSPGPHATSVPQATSPGPQATSAPQATSPGPGPTSGPHATSPGPGPTSAPQATSPGPGGTSAPQATSPGPGGTSAPQATSPGPQSTSQPRATSHGPRATP